MNIFIEINLIDKPMKVILKQKSGSDGDHTCRICCNYYLK